MINSAPFFFSSLNPLFVVFSYVGISLFLLITDYTYLQVCAARGPRPRYPRVWKTNKKIGTISKSHKLVERVSLFCLSFVSGWEVLVFLFSLIFLELRWT